MNRVVLVAGASSGVGRDAAASLAARGHTVYGTSRDVTRVDAPGVTPVALEVTDDRSVRACVEEVVERAGGIDAVVYSAGFYVAGSAEETDPELAIAQLDAYLVGAHRLVRAVLPHMRRRGGGRLLLMSSTAAVAAIPFHSVYSASKAALNHYAEALRYEVEPFGVRVACVEATSVRTGAATALRTGAPLPVYQPVRDKVLDRFRRLQLEGPEPTAVSREIVRAVEARRMRPLYRVGLQAKTLPVLRAVLPRRLFAHLYGRFFGLGRPPGD
ncbi:SDR family NAD(P)-dependent oxidoreductase [Nonomuraea sp. SYSU D8015]|uniref:SDR family NAD(P)-dependent oxidoreductase n=1 Tax=Nonomuraea sp. SYSU D8015 TaxID=2593644 RepID=UPI0016618720|nr:SDR family NAD(P)-dependent oxidoreductase [Nonomuraea sp. SYSU D8015]